MRTTSRMMARLGFMLLLNGLSSQGFALIPINPQQCSRLGTRRPSIPPNHNSAHNNNDEWRPSELVDQEDDDEDLDWLPDRGKTRLKQKLAKEYYKYEQSPQPQRVSQIPNPTEDEKVPTGRVKPIYTVEEEELIALMGGKSGSPLKREPGYLGDSTLTEIATDYSVPVCYLADVLCTWGVPVPINVNDRLGDLVTGEQAFAILEAINSLDVSALQDRYSNYSLSDLCDLHDIDIKTAFQMAIKEGWSLPFGVQTCLRVEQEDELLRVLGSIV